MQVFDTWVNPLQPKKWFYRGSIQRFAFREPTSLNKSSMQFRTKSHCIWYLQFPTLQPLIRSSTTRTTRTQSLPVSKLRSIVNDALLSRVSSIFKDGSKLRTSLAGHCPSKTRPWRPLFVVPSDVASAFKLQELNGDTARGKWAGKVRQYVVGLEEQTTFGKRSDPSVCGNFTRKGKLNDQTSKPTSFKGTCGKVDPLRPACSYSTGKGQNGQRPAVSVRFLAPFDSDLVWSLQKRRLACLHCRETRRCST